MPSEVSRVNAVIAISALTLMALGFFVPFGWKVVLPFVTTGIAPADWSWPTVGLALLVMLALFLCLGYTLFQRFGTKLTETDIAVPTLRGVRRLRWDQVERVGLRGHELLIEGPSGTITLNLLCFKHPADVEAYVRSHLPTRLGGGVAGAA